MRLLRDLLIVGLLTGPTFGQEIPSLKEAESLAASGRFDQALQEADQLVAVKPPVAGVDSLRGMIFYQQGKMTDAAAAFAMAVAKNPQDVESMQMEGVSLFRQGKPAEAVPLLEKAHTSVPSANIDPNYVLGLCYMDTRRYDDARKAFASQYGFPSDSAPAYLLAARMLLRRDYLPIAEDSARKALALNPKLPLAHLLLGQVALANSQFPEAIAELQKERDLNPLFGLVYERMGDAYIHSGDYDQAYLALNKAVLLDPTATGPFILLGKVLLRQKNPLMARLYLERAVKMDPGNYMAHSLLGQTYRSLGRSDDAAKEANTAQQIQSADTPVLESPK